MCGDTQLYNVPEGVVRAQTRDTSNGRQSPGEATTMPCRAGHLCVCRAVGRYPAGPSLDWSPSSKGTNGSPGLRPQQEVASRARAGLRHSRLSRIQADAHQRGICPNGIGLCLAPTGLIYPFNEYLPGSVMFGFMCQGGWATVPRYLFSQTYSGCF